MRVFSRIPLNLNQTTVPRGIVYLIPERCKGCSLCVHFCPTQVLMISKKTNNKGYHYPEIAPGKKDECVNCEFCTMICPEFAIFSQEIIGNSIS